MAPICCQMEAEISQSTIDTSSEYEWQNSPGNIVKDLSNIDSPFQVQYVNNSTSQNRHAYVVRPVSLWASMEKYKNFIVAERKYGVHDYVCVNRSPKVPGVTQPNATVIARVLEVRAHSTKDVYLRVFWMYRPEQLPSGLEPHHGEYELIASNEMGVIDATSVEGHADVTHWIEAQQEEAPDGIYWRQTFDHLTKQLSLLRLHCTCSGYRNPDKSLIHCTNPVCNLSLHEGCIIGATLTRLRQEAAYPMNVGASSSSSAKRNPKNGRQGKDGASFTHHQDFDAVIGDDVTTGKLVITDTRDAKKPKSWYEDIRCLRCLHVIDPDSVYA